MNHINYNKNERYDKNYNYVQNKINQISKKSMFIKKINGNNKTKKTQFIKLLIKTLI